MNDKERSKEEERKKRENSYKPFFSLVLGAFFFLSHTLSSFFFPRDPTRLVCGRARAATDGERRRQRIRESKGEKEGEGDEEKANK